MAIAAAWVYLRLGQGFSRGFVESLVREGNATPVGGHLLRPFVWAAWPVAFLVAAREWLAHRRRAR